MQQSFGFRLVRSSLLGLALAAGAACSDEQSPKAERDAGASPVIDGCTPAECGPRPSTGNYLCADGTLAGPGPCERMEDGTCGYLSHLCAHLDGGPGDASAVDAGELDGAEADASERDAATGVRCGVRGAPECGEGKYCELGTDSQCGALDQGGTCQDLPALCDRKYDPVCACDSRSYDNACNAKMLGLTVMHEGLCTVDECTAIGGSPTRGIGDAPPVCGPSQPGWAIGRPIDALLCCMPAPVPGASCGGIGGRRCGVGLFCNYDADVGGSSRCGLHDGTGVCSLRPDNCSDAYEPVCGCDRRTYSTACAAHAASMSVLHDGACTERDCVGAGGQPVIGNGGELVCADSQQEHGRIVGADGTPYIEGAICCLPL